MPKLPNGDRAVVDPEKLSGYCLNPSHSVGRSKARVFASIGIRKNDANELKAALLSAAESCEARFAGATPYGDRYIVDFGLPREGRTRTIRSAWIIRVGEEIPRLTTCYVL